MGVGKLNRYVAGMDLDFKTRPQNTVYTLYMSYWAMLIQTNLI